MSKRKAGVAALILAAVLPIASPASAHGAGVRSDLPLDLTLALSGAGIAVVFSFAALGVLWERPLLAPRAVIRPVGGSSLATSGAWLLRVLGALATVIVVVVGLADRSDPNLAVETVYAVFWVGIPFLTFFVGDIWRLLSPFETAARLLGDRLPDPELDAAAEERYGWLAIVPLFVFLWLELAYVDGAEPRIVASAVLMYVVGMMVLLLRRGAASMRHAEGFGVFFSLLARLSPVGRTDDGRLGFRWPLTGPTTLEPRRPTMTLLLVVLGGTSFDGFTRTVFWNETFVGQKRGWELTAVNTFGLVALIAVVIGLYLLGSAIGSRIAGTSTESFALEFAHTLIPIALAYAVAHYFSLILDSSQLSLIQLSDPFDAGWNLLGTADWTVNFSLVTTTGIGWVQFLSIVIGHVIAVVLSHDRSLERFSPAVAFRSQFPLLVVMVIYTVGGLFLLAGA